MRQYRRAAGADDLVALRAFWNVRLERSDIARLLQTAGAGLAHLQAEIDRVAPAKLLEQLDEATVAVSGGIDRAATRLHGALADQLARAQVALVPRATLRLHERFWGPFAPG